MNYSKLMKENIAIQLINNFGAQELDRDAPQYAARVSMLKDLGYEMYPEAFNEEAWCLPVGENPKDGFKLSGSQMTRLALVYDPKRWVIE